VISLDHKQENAFFDCSQSKSFFQLFRGHKKIVFLCKYHHYYEPIVHIAFKKEIIETKHHSLKNVKVRNALQSLFKGCNEDYMTCLLQTNFCKAIKSLHLNIVAAVINYMLKVIGFIIAYKDAQIFIPLPNTEYLIPCLYPTVIFHTSIHSKVYCPNQKTKTELEKNIFPKIRNTVSKVLNIQYIKEFISDTTNFQDLIQEFNLDISIFTDYEKTDKRKQFIQNNEIEENKYILFRNEAVKGIIQNPHILFKIDLLKHPLSPLSIDDKITILNEILITILSNLICWTPPEMDTPTEFTNKLCSDIKTRNECEITPHCSNIISTKPNICIYRVNKKNKNLFLLKVIHEILSSNELKYKNIRRYNLKQKDFIFDYDDIHKFNKLSCLLHKITNFKKEKIEIIKQPFSSTFSQPMIQDFEVENVKDVRVDYRSNPMFEHIKFVQLKNNNLLLEKLVQIYNFIQSTNNMNINTLKYLLFKNLLYIARKNDDIRIFENTFVHTLYPNNFDMKKIRKFYRFHVNDYPHNYELSDLDFNFIANILDINILRFLRKTLHVNDILRCLGRDITRKYYIILRGDNNKNKVIDWSLAENIKTKDIVFCIDDLPKDNNLFFAKCSTKKIPKLINK